MKLNLLRNLGVTLFAAFTIIGCSSSDDNGGNNNGNDDTLPIGGEFDIVQDFDISLGGEGISASAMQNDGKILIVTTSGIFRLNPDGSADNSFNVSGIPHNTASSFFRSMAVQNDGKILLGYLSNSGSGQVLFRLNENGSVDNSFNPTISGDYSREIKAILPLNDGTIIIGGWFSKVNGASRYYLARLTQTGSLVQGFNAPISNEHPHGPHYVQKLFPVSNNRFMATGIFRTDVFSPLRSNIVVFDYNGNLVESFNFTEDLTIEYPLPRLQRVLSVTPTADGNFLFGGEFNSIMKIDPNGNKIDSFSFINEVEVGEIHTMVAINDNQFLVGSQVPFPYSEYLETNQFLSVYNPSSQIFERISLGYDRGAISNIIKESNDTYLLFGRFGSGAAQDPKIIRIKKQ